MSEPSALVQELRRLNREWLEAQYHETCITIMALMRERAKNGKKNVKLSGSYEMPKNENICYWFLYIDDKLLGQFMKSQARVVIEGIFRLVDNNNGLSIYRYNMTREQLLHNIETADTIGETLGDHVITWNNIGCDS